MSTTAAIVLGGYLLTLAFLFLLSWKRGVLGAVVDELRWWVPGGFIGLMGAALSRSMPWPVTAILMLVSAGLIGYAHRRDQGRLKER